VRLELLKEQNQNKHLVEQLMVVDRLEMERKGLVRRVE